MADTRPAIELKDVHLALGSYRFHFDLALKAGAVTAITGPSGSGKSTLLNLVAGFELPDRGRISIDGNDVTDSHPSERAVSLVFQDNNLFAHLDLFTNIGLGISPSLRLKSNDRAAISQALERVGLAGFEKRMPGTLSGGERQRAAFARALVRQKPVLLLDEPFVALDPGLRLSMASLLLALNADANNTVLIISHDPDEVERLADEVIFLDHGDVLLQASADAFMARRDIPEIAEFLAG